MSFPTRLYGRHGTVLAESATKKYPLGTPLELPDGRVYRYTRAGGTALDIGKLMQEAVVITGHTCDQAAAAAVIGATQVTVTLVTNNVTVNQYAEGYLFIDSGPGAGQMCTIKSHPAAAATATCVFTLEDEDALTVALTIASDVGLRKNLWDGAIVFPTTITGAPVGVTPRAVTEDYYCWLQTWGPAAVLTAGVLVRGNNVVPMTTAGAVGPSAGDLFPVVGVCMSVAPTTEYSLVYLTIAP